jgi:DNA-binding transcriptional LysR family regulator
MKGQELMLHAEEMLGKRNAMLSALHNTDAFAGKFCFGVTELVAATWLPTFVSRIKSKYPNLSLTFEVDMAFRLLDRLSSFQIDLVIAPTTTGFADFEALPLPSLELNWMCGRQVEVPDRVLSVAELGRYPFLAQPDSSAMQAMITQHLAENRVKVDHVISCNSMISLAELTASGFGVTCLPTRSFGPELAAGSLRAIETTPALPGLPYSAFFRRDSVDISADIAAMAEGACDFSRPRH